MGNDPGRITVTTLHRFPVKSLGGQSLQRAPIHGLGLEGDRRWMVVNDRGRCVTRRELPDMARIEALPGPDGLILRHADAGEIQVSIPPSASALTPVKIWRDEVPAQMADRKAGDYLSALLGKALRLVYLPDASHRQIDPAFAAIGDGVSFADGFPILVTSVESLAALNARLARPIAMLRFRPNIVVSGLTEAWGEDRWRRIRIGAVTLRIVKPCDRCVVTTQDPATGQTVDGNEPLASLRAMGRRIGTGIMFGQNAIPEGRGDIAVGDTVEILEAGDSNLGLAENRKA